MRKQLFIETIITTQFDLTVIICLKTTLLFNRSFTMLLFNMTFNVIFLNIYTNFNQTKLSQNGLQIFLLTRI